MIKNKFAHILIQKRLKITQVSNDTGISRTTLTALHSNSGKGIQYDTLNTLCKYLKVTPSDFFDYIPIDVSINMLDIEVKEKKTGPETGYKIYSLAGFINISDVLDQKSSIEFNTECYQSFQEVNIFLKNGTKTAVNLQIDFAKEELEKYMRYLAIGGELYYSETLYLLEDAVRVCLESQFESIKVNGVTTNLTPF